LPCENENPLIDAILRQQTDWQGALFKAYPAFMRHARPLRASEDGDGKTSFETYLRAELETFSATTLASLFREIERKKAAGINMSEESYELLLKEKGLPPLAEMERRMATA
jgi:hypothetical protein